MTTQKVPKRSARLIVGAAEDFLQQKPPSTKQKSLPAKVYDTKKTWPDTISGIRDILASGKTGVTKGHIEAFQNVANRTNTMLGIRPVDVFCATLIEEGYPSKNFHIKGKSSDWGPQIGFIPVNQFYSKLQGKDEEKIKQFNKKVDSSIQEGHAEPIQLSISRTRLKELFDNNVIHSASSEEIPDRFDFSCERNGKTFSFVARWDAKESDVKKFDIFVKNNKKEEELMVLADPQTHEGLTADYDLLIVSPSLESLDLARQDKLPVPGVSHTILQQRLEKYQKSNRVSKESMNLLPKDLLPKGEAPREAALKEFYANEDPDIGNATDRVRAMIGTLNQEINRGQGRNMVHHNSDDASPATDLEANFPCLVFIPHKEPMLLQTKEAFEEVCKNNNKKYFIRQNPLWKGRVQASLVSERSKTFEQKYKNVINKAFLKKNTNADGA